MSDTYTLLRQFADSWFLLVMLAFFLGCVFWAFRPGSRGLHREAARSILDDTDLPVSGAGSRGTTGEGRQ